MRLEHESFAAKMSTSLLVGNFTLLFDIQNNLAQCIGILTLKARESLISS
jgi:hypothetical protein